VAFVATPRGIESLRIPRRYWGEEVGVVAIPVSEEEVRGAELQTSSYAGTWPRVVTRADLLAPALSRLLGGEHVELSLQPGRDGLRATLLTDAGEEQPFPVAPKDALGFLGAVFQHAPRGVVTTAGGRARRVLLCVRPAARPHEYRVRIAGVVDTSPPATLADIGLSPAVLELLLQNLERRAGLLLVSGGPASGRSTTLDLLALTLSSRGRAGGRIGPRARVARPELPWLAEALSDWPFPESLMAASPEFVLVEHLERSSDLLLAARLASCGSLVVAGALGADPESLEKSVAQRLATGSAPAVPVAVLGQTIVRTPCRACRGWTTLPVEQVRRLGFHRRDVEEIERRGGLAMVRGQGCGDCARTGASGLAGVQEFVDPGGGSLSLPRLREEGWRKAMQGLVCVEDVITLCGAQRPMRTLGEILVHAGLSLTAPAGLAGGPAEVPGPGAPRAGLMPGTREEEGPESPSGPVVAEAQALALLLKDSRAGPPGDGKRLSSLTKAIATRAASAADLGGLLAPAGGFRLAGHSVNAALITARIWAALGNEEGRRVILLALVHDAALVKAGIDPDAELPAVATMESFDAGGGRLAPGPVLERLGPEAAGLEEAVLAVQRLVRFEQPSAEEKARADLGAQVVALACLVELHRQGPGEHGPIDLHDVTSLVMEQHGRRFGPALFRALLKAIPIFPIDCLVELSSGDLARVVSLNEDNHFRPRVEITASAAGEEQSERRVIDLARAPFLHIRHRVTGAVPTARVAV
jgi:hypothetical protein